jgi:tRNA threonylcarbamoyladenosine biosynthesis protein TsaE
MSTKLMWQTVSTSSNATEQLGEQLGRRLKGREVIELVSDLGGGKTTLVHGLARGIGSQDHVSSPTFKISNEYSSKQLTLYHFDFYRLQDPGVVAHELHDVLDDPSAVVVVEWSDIVQHVLPEGRLTIELQATGENQRHISIMYPTSLKYLVENI